MRFTDDRNNGILRDVAEVLHVHKASPLKHTCLLNMRFFSSLGDRISMNMCRNKLLSSHTLRVKQSHYRPGQVQRVPGS